MGIFKHPEKKIDGDSEDEGEESIEGDSSTDEDGEEEDDDDEEEGGEKVEDDDDDDEEGEDSEDSDDDESAPVKRSKTAIPIAKAATKEEREWEAAHFTKRARTDDGAVVFKMNTGLFPEMTFFTREALVEFAEGNKYRRMRADMRKGMRTHDDNTRLKAKAAARKIRQVDRRAEAQKLKRERRKESVMSLSEAVIEERKAK